MRKMRSGAAALIVVLLIAVGVARIVAGYTVLSVTYDEREQVASGAEWLVRGTYTYDVVHPPFSRVLAAFGPWLHGDVPPMPQTTDDSTARRVGDAILFGKVEPRFAIALVRAGNLPWFILACCAVFLLAPDSISGLIAVLLFTTVPPVLAHAGLATTDMAATATTALAVLAFVRWLDVASIGRAVALGAALGFAAVSKLSCLVFVPACMVVLTAWYLALHRSRLDLVRRVKGLACTVPVAALIIWACYRFSFASLPAPEFIAGVRAIIQHNSAGHWSYLLGDVSQTGWWYFFPVALLVKTPLAMLILALIGGCVFVVRSWRETYWQLAVAPLCCIALLPVLMASRIDIGVRHALPIYCFLSVAAGCGAVALSRRLAGASIVGLLCVWQIVASLAWHPDYLAYFNELTLLRHDPVLIDSDLDWGQDFFRLSSALRERRIDEVAVAMSDFRSCTGSGDHDAADYHFPTTTILRPDERRTGWIAASYRALYIADGYSWLLQLSPVAQIGQSILLYHVSDADLQRLNPERLPGRQPVDACKL